MSTVQHRKFLQVKEWFRTCAQNAFKPVQWVIVHCQAGIVWLRIQRAKLIAMYCACQGINKIFAALHGSYNLEAILAGLLEEINFTLTVPSPRNKSTGMPLYHPTVIESLYHLPGCEDLRPKEDLDERCQFRGFRSFVRHGGFTGCMCKFNNVPLGSACPADESLL